MKERGVTCVFVFLDAMCRPCLDFGVILGSRLYLKELTNRALIERESGGNVPVFQEGDIVLKINSTPTEGLSLKEARKIMDSCKDKLQLTVRREVSAVACAPAGLVGGPQQHHQHHQHAHQHQHQHPSRSVDPYDPSQQKDVGAGPGGHLSNYADNRPNYCNQNLYVQPPTRGASVDYHRANPYDDKSNLSRLTGRSRGPLMDVSLSQLDQAMGHHGAPNGHNDMGEDAPPRPPPPRTEGSLCFRQFRCASFTHSSCCVQITTEAAAPTKTSTNHPRKYMHFN